MPNPQSYANHARYQPFYHFLASPVAYGMVLVAFWTLFKSPTFGNAIDALVALGLAAAVVMSRVMAVTVQNRVIRLEMRLRLKEVLPPEMQPRIRDLSVRQLIALRFASDAELPGLVERTLKGESEKPRDIKKAIKDWQPDYLRC